MVVPQGSLRGRMPATGEMVLAVDMRAGEGILVVAMAARAVDGTEAEEDAQVVEVVWAASAASKVAAQAVAVMVAACGVSVGRQVATTVAATVATPAAA